MTCQVICNNWPENTRWQWLVQVYEGVEGKASHTDWHNTQITVHIPFAYLHVWLSQCLNVSVYIIDGVTAKQRFACQADTATSRRTMTEKKTTGEVDQGFVILHYCDLY